MKRLFSFLFVISALAPLYGQEGNIDFGYVQTALKKDAVNFAVDYAKKLEPKLELFKPGNRSLFSFTPDFNVLVGSDDAFNGISAKYVGNIMRFDTVTIAGISGIPDLSKTFYNFPVSIGIESNQKFSFVNGLIEAGFVPWYQNVKNLSSSIRQTKVGIFLQGGYKFPVGDSVINQGGASDESNELINDNIFRAKLIFGFSPTFFIDDDRDFGFSIIGNSITWYDFLNNKVYYKLEGKLRMIIRKDFSFDFGYEKGSGAPNFNEGDQFSANLSICF